MKSVAKFSTEPTPPMEVEVTQHKNGQFCVTYGKQRKSHLSYTEAAHEFGLCCFHAMQCAGKIDADTDED